MPGLRDGTEPRRRCAPGAWAEQQERRDWSILSARGTNKWILRISGRDRVPWPLEIADCALAACGEVRRDLDAVGDVVRRSTAKASRIPDEERGQRSGWAFNLVRRVPRQV